MGPPGEVGFRGLGPDGSSEWPEVDLTWGQVQQKFPGEELRVKVKETMWIIIVMGKGRARGQGVSKCRSRTRSELNMRAKQESSGFYLLMRKGCLFLDALLQESLDLDESPHDGICIFMKRGRDQSSLSLPCEDTASGWSSASQEEGSQQEDNLAGPWILDFPVSSSVRNTYLLLESPSLWYSVITVRAKTDVINFTLF